MSSLSDIWNTKRLSIQTKVRAYLTLVLSILLYASEACTSHTSDMKAIESFHVKCQRRIFGIGAGHDFVRNSEVSLHTVSHLCLTGLPEQCHIRTCGKIARNIPAHKSSYRSVDPILPTWKRPPGRPRTKWTDQFRRDNNNVPIATLWRQAIGRGHSRATLRSEPTIRVDGDDDHPHDPRV